MTIDQSKPSLRMQLSTLTRTCGCTLCGDLKVHNIIRQRADVSVVDDDGSTALHVVRQKQMVGSVSQWLLEDRVNDVDPQDKNDVLLLEPAQASGSGNPAAVKAIIEAARKRAEMGAEDSLSRSTGASGSSLGGGAGASDDTNNGDGNGNGNASVPTPGNVPRVVSETQESEEVPAAEKPEATQEESGDKPSKTASGEETAVSASATKVRVVRLGLRRRSICFTVGLIDLPHLCKFVHMVVCFCFRTSVRFCLCVRMCTCGGVHLEYLTRQRPRSPVFLAPKTNVANQR